METNSLNVDVQPTYVRCKIKDKITQLVWPEDIMCEQAKIQRSTTTGELVITAPKSNLEDLVARKMRLDKTKELLQKKRQLENLKEQ